MAFTYAQIKRNTSTVQIGIDSSDIGALLREFNTLPGEFDKAEIRALNKTAQWVKGYAARAVSQKIKIAAKVIRNRLRILRADRKRGRVFARVWLGTNPIAADSFGRARQTRTGVTVGSRQFPHAFLATMPHGVGNRRQGVYLRSNLGRNHELSRGGSRWSKGRPHSSSPNLPVFKPRVDIENEANAAIRSLEALAGARLVTVLRQELNYIINVAKRR